MAYNLATAYVPIVPSMEGVGKAIEKAFGDASQNAGSKGGGQAGKGFASGLLAKGGIIGAAAAVTTKAMGVISNSIGSAVGRADQMNNFPKVMKNLGYSSQDAAASIKKISNALDGLPTTKSGNDRHGAAARPTDLEPRRGHRHLLWRSTTPCLQAVPSTMEPGERAHPVHANAECGQSGHAGMAFDSGRHAGPAQPSGRGHAGRREELKRPV